MVKFLFVGDLHLRGTNPRNRIDDYKEVSCRQCCRRDLTAWGYIRPAGSWYSRSSGICRSVKGKSGKHLLYTG